jgi:hypothetical protein
MTQREEAIEFARQLAEDTELDQNIREHLEKCAVLAKAFYDQHGRPYPPHLESVLKWLSEW